MCCLPASWKKKHARYASCLLNVVVQHYNVTTLRCHNDDVSSSTRLPNWGSGITLTEAPAEKVNIDISVKPGIPPHDFARRSPLTAAGKV